MDRKNSRAYLITFIFCMLLVVGCFIGYLKTPTDDGENDEDTVKIPQELTEYGFDYRVIPEFDGQTPFVAVNDNLPFFKESMYVENAYE